MNQQKGFASIVLIVLVIALIGVAGYFVLVKKSPEVAQQTNTPAPMPTQTKTQNPTPTPTPKEETAGWQNHANADIGFSFKYPQTWKVEDGLKVNTCCLNLFNFTNPYQGDFLKQNAMKAQFQYHVDASISSKQQYIEGFVKSSGESEIGSLINKSSIVSVKNENGLDILKFNGGVGDTGYVIPKKANFSEVIYIIVWNPDLTFEKVLSNFKFTNPSSLSPISSPITFLFPNGGEKLIKGKTYKITWKTSASFNSGYPQVSITLITSKGKQAVTPNQQITTNNTGSFDWAVPTTQLSGYIQDYSGGSYTLRTLDDQSEFHFLIRGYPHTTGRAEGPFDYTDGSFYIVSQ